MGCIFQKFDRIYKKKVVPQHNENVYEISHWRGSTSGAPPLTKAPLHGVCRANIYEKKLVGIRLTTYIMMLHRCIFGPNPHHTKICSDHVIFIPTWMLKRVQDLDLRNDADCELLSYGAYVAKEPRYQAAVKRIPSRDTLDSTNLYALRCVYDCVWHVIFDPPTMNLSTAFVIIRGCASAVLRDYNMIELVHAKLTHTYTATRRLSGMHVCCASVILSVFQFFRFV